MKLSTPIILALFGWVLIFGVTLNLAMRDDLFQDDLTGIVIANVDDYKGRVQVRAEGVALWSYVTSDHELVDGSILATGTKSIAYITFKSGRRIEVAPNSQIVISREDEDSNDFSVILLKGQIRSKENKNDKEWSDSSKMTVHIDDAAIVSDKKSDRITFQKNTDEKKPTIQVRKGKPKLTKGKVGVFNSSKGALESISADKNEPFVNISASEVSGFTGRLDDINKATADEKAVKGRDPIFNDISSAESSSKSSDAPDVIKVASLGLKAKRPHKAKGIDKDPFAGIRVTGIKPKISEEEALKIAEEKEIQRRGLFGRKKLTGKDETKLASRSTRTKSGKSRLLPLDIITPSNQFWITDSVQRGKVPGFGISLAKANKRPRTSHKHVLEIGAQKIDISRKIAKNGGELTVPGSTLRSAFRNSGGVGSLYAHTRVGKKKRSDRVRYDLISLADFPSTPLIVRLDRLASKKPSAKWKIANDIPGNFAPYVVELASGRSLVDMAPLIEGSNRFSIHSGSFQISSATLAFLYGPQKILAKVYGNPNDLIESAKIVGEAVGGEVIVKSSQKSLLANLDRNSPVFSAKVLADTNKKYVYLLVGGKIVPIKRSLLKNSRMARQVVNRNGNALFKNRVKVTRASRD